MTCEACWGAGTVPCATCGGSARLAQDAGVIINADGEGSAENATGSDGVSYHGWATCPDCGGDDSNCTTCGGSGHLSEDAGVVINDSSGAAENATGSDGASYHGWVTCPDCDNGRVTCMVCGGTGETPE